MSAEPANVFGFRCISLTEQRTEQRLSHSVTRVARFHLHGTAGQLIKPPADLDDSSHEQKLHRHKQCWRLIAATCTCTKCAVVSVSAEGLFLALHLVMCACAETETTSPGAN